MFKFTKKELNKLFLMVTGVLYPELGIIQNLQKQDKAEFENIMIKLDTILESMDKNKSDNALN